MPTVYDRQQQVLESLAAKEYRDLYAADHIRVGIAIQVRATRESRGWTQLDLAEQSGVTEKTIVQLEDPDDGRLTIKILKKVASALDVALVVRLETFSSLTKYTSNLTSSDLAVPGFEEYVTGRESSS